MVRKWAGSSGAGELERGDGWGEEGTWCGDTHLAPVNVSVLDSRGHVTLATNIDTLRECLAGGWAVLLVRLVQDGDDRLELIGANLFQENALGP